MALAAMVVLALAANGQELRLTQRGEVDSSAMGFEARHVSVERCDSINNKVGRGTDANGIYGSLADTNASVNTTAAIVEHSKALIGEEPPVWIVDTPLKRKEHVGEETPAWIADLQQNGKDYQTERTRRAKENEDLLSEYSQTELNIAKYMGLSPQMIDRNQLRKWAQETESDRPTP
jgi:hypothetical protein